MQVSLTFVIELTAVGVLTNLLYFPQQIYIIKKWEPNSILCDTSSFINRTQKISIMYSITAQNKDKSTATMILQIIKTRYKLSSLLMYLPMMYHTENNDTPWRMKLQHIRLIILYKIAHGIQKCFVYSFFELTDGI